MVDRVLAAPDDDPLTLLAPDIVEALPDGKQGPEGTPAQELEPFPVAWEQQCVKHV
ncbi:hypothetical protein [Tropicibacter sp. S64]|uniref:hypothetical protein n=1 Tax=Tropicibacter sp. S64 TaxID=3415122 RepID=UPI003C7BD497